MRTRFLASLGTLFTSTALAFSQVPSGYYSPYPAAPGYGSYPAYAGMPGYGSWPGYYPYGGSYDPGYVSVAPAAVQPAETLLQAQPLPPGKGAAEKIGMPKEAGKDAAPSNNDGAAAAPTATSTMPADAAADAPGWFDRFSTGDTNVHAWASADYLRWTLRRAPLPIPLVTTGDPTSALPGALGQPGTQTLFGGSGFTERSYSGFQGDLGVWINDEHNWGVQASGFVLPKSTHTVGLSSDGSGNPPLYIPVFRTDLNMERSVVVADPLALLTPPGPITGAVAIPTYSQFWGLELNGVAGTVLSGAAGKLDLLVGVRYLDLREGLELDVQSTAVNQGIQTQLFDRFSTSNRFYGGQVGAHSHVEWSIVSLELTGKVAIGSTHESSVINGATTVTGAGAAMVGTFPGGIFTTPSNIGRITSNTFSVVPQVEARLGLRICDAIQVFAAYDFLYWSDVVRPGDQINRNVNFSQLLGGPQIGPPSPLPQLNTTFFWAQGVSVGMEISF